MSLAHRLHDIWYTPHITPAAAVLWPLSVLYGAVAGARRFAYRAGWLERERLAVPVVVVGNISVGGTGKTPIVRALVAELAARKFHPGIVSRGYRARRTDARVVAPEDSPREVGDEPAMLARDGVPVAVGAARAQAARALLAAHPSVDVIVCDDGLQHYALERDVEIAVIDAQRGFGNGLLLPAGPLREPVGRLRDVDAIVYRSVSAGEGEAPAQSHAFVATEEVLPLRNLLDPALVADIASLSQGTVHAVAGIADPGRFFARLRALGLSPRCHAFADHHDFVRADVEFAGATAIVMTEKDAVKCAAFADARMWFLPLRARIDPALTDLVEEAIRGPQAA